jgi:hypothetical protein
MLKKESFQLERRCGLEEFQTSICLGGCMGKIYSVHDVQIFFAIVKIRCREPEQGDSLFRYHIHRWIHSIHFSCEADGKILF